MRRIVSLRDLADNDCIVKWRMTEMCNIRCSYCLRNDRRDRGRKMDGETLRRQNDELRGIALSIAEMLSASRFKNVKIDLVGGEVTVLDLEKIIPSLACGKARAVQITTNLMADADRYIGIQETCHGIGVAFELTASLHYEFQDIDAYFSKIKKIKAAFSGSGFNDSLVCEMVSTKDSQPLAAEFVRRCSALGADYSLDRDSRAGESGGMDGLLHGAARTKGPRFRVSFDDGTVKEYLSTRELLSDSGIDGARRRRLLATKGYLCTNSCSYVYIDYGTAVGRTAESASCCNRMPIESFRFLDRPAPCPHDYCSLCGHMSLEAAEWQPLYP